MVDPVGTGKDTDTGIRRWVGRGETKLEVHKGNLCLIYSTS